MLVQLLRLTVILSHQRIDFPLIGLPQLLLFISLFFLLTQRPPELLNLLLQGRHAALQPSIIGLQHTHLLLVVLDVLLVVALLQLMQHPVFLQVGTEHPHLRFGLFQLQSIDLSCLAIQSFYLQGLLLVRQL